MVEMGAYSPFEPSHSIIWHINRHPDRVYVCLLWAGMVDPNEVATEHPAIGLVSFRSRQRGEDLHGTEI